MKRRDFFGSAVTAGLLGSASAFAGPVAPPQAFTTGAYRVIPDKISGMLIEELREEYDDLLFRQYLPFWENGGIDDEYGGFMCELRDDGTVETPQKDIWYQGRGIWVYSFLYNNFDKNPKWLGIAKKARDFMVGNMHRGDGTWEKTVSREGKPMAGAGQGSSKDIYGAMFAAGGLIQYYRAAGNEEDLELAKKCVLKSAERYEKPDYDGVTERGYDRLGLRSQGHSFMMVWVLPQILEVDDDPRIDALAREHLDHILNHFWNPDYGISNEKLNHDYSRIPHLATKTAPGHTLETQWMAMIEAIREMNGTTFYILKNRIRRMLEMSWDYIFEGMGDTEYNVFATDDRPAGPVWDLKSMWAHTEILVGTLMTLEYTGDVWAKEWYERARDYILRTMKTDHGVFRQAVDRYGEDLKRPGISIYRKGNFHQPRALMMNMLTLDRIIANKGKLTPFPL